MIVKNFYDLKKLVLAWDLDYTKVTQAERTALEEAEKDIAENGTISHDNINWDQEVIYITIQEQIKTAAIHGNITLAEVAKKVGMSPQSFSNRMKTGKFTRNELDEIGKALGAEYISCFRFPDGSEY